MIDEHEIPSGSRLYFGASAKLKREIETAASQFLDNAGFKEIVTPFFSYHQHQSISTKELIKFSDAHNHTLSLRADSTQDVVRLITKRLGRSTNHNKWFYIQPVFRYPSIESNQIGAEFIDNDDLGSSISVCKDIFAKFSFDPLLHISNINIPRIIAKELHVSLDIFEKAQLQKILALDIAWIQDLVHLQNLSDIDALIAKVPQNIKGELLKMKQLALASGYKHIVLSPLYYAQMRYYDALFFRFIDKNITLAKGGSYESEGMRSSGFAIYTDAFIETMKDRKNHEK
ncbi:MAG: ATP phosphoribosyltransferase regulatory subunit [Sulfurospirillum sp.]|nr:ATP phosphoribosyltransferase regulatory subunit [Sulfurospirillum sp.]